jgi:MFS family permease
MSQRGLTTSTSSAFGRGLGAQRVSLAVICAAIFLDALDLSITQISLPAIADGLHISPSALPWVATAYVVTYGGFMLLGGRLADRLGHRSVFLAGIAIFGAMSAVAGLADSGAVLIAARSVQGVGAALTVPAAVALLAATFAEGPARNRAFATFAAAAASGFAVGLVAGGLLTDGLSWRWIFLVKVPLVILMRAAGLRTLVRPAAAASGPTDVVGAVAGTAGVVLITYAITRVGAPRLTVGALLVPALAGVLALALFVARQARAPQPLIPLRLLAHPVTATNNLAALTVLAAPFAVSYIATSYLQTVEDQRAWTTAAVLLPGAVASALVSRYVAGRALDRFGLNAVYVTGLLTVAAGDAMLLGLDRGDGLLVGVSALISFGLGMGLAYPAATAGGIATVPQADHGAAAGINNTALQIGGAIGLAAVATAITATLGGHSVDVVGSQRAIDALHTGAIVATVIPILGAAAAGLGNRRRRHA